MAAEPMTTISNVTATTGRHTATESKRHLELVQYTAPGERPGVCAAIWREGNYVHLASPLLPLRQGVRDPQAYGRQFPQSMASIDDFADAMTWLDAACYAAADPHEVELACNAHPEWRLQCIPYDGGDVALSDLNGLLRATEKAGPMPPDVVRDCLLELIKQIFKAESALSGAQVEKIFHEGDEVATLDIGVDRCVAVTLLSGVMPSDAMLQAQSAHLQMSANPNSRVQYLAVAPHLHINQPIFMSESVAITDMDASHIRAALIQMVRS